MLSYQDAEKKINDTGKELSKEIDGVIIIGVHRKKATVYVDYKDMADVIIMNLGVAEYIRHTHGKVLGKLISERNQARKNPTDKDILK